MFKTRTSHGGCLFAALSLSPLLIALLLQSATAEPPAPFTKDTGYRGIWYYNQKVDTEYVYKYSGGLGTYCSSHFPFAIYRPEVKKTFFVYGGTEPGKNNLWEMVSYYDHATGQVPRPTFLMDKKTDDAHDNPVLAIDDTGYLYVFASAHGTSRPAYIFRSKQPYSIDDFDQILETNYSYPQPWHIPGKGFLFLHTHYENGRALFTWTSPDGKQWSERKPVAKIDQGHYQVSCAHGEKVGAAFNYHPNAFQGDPKRKGLNWRTNLYYIETVDMGNQWRSARGEILNTPLSTRDNPALVHDYEADGRLVYVMDLNYDEADRPAILYLTAATWEPGPAGEPREWRIARWTGTEWAIHVITTSDSNYDMGSLWIEPDGLWRVIGPTDEGPQRYNPGGEMVLWTSADHGATWKRIRNITQNSPLNHTYARRTINAQPDFYAFWADGHGRQPSESRLYFCDQSGENVFRLPYTMDSDFATPERITP